MGTGKLNSNLVWLFALGAIILGIGGGWLTAGMGQKVSAAVFLGVFAIAGFCCAYLTEAGTGKAIGAMVAASLATAVIYYFVIGAIMSKAVDVASLGQADGKASGVMGTFFGSFAAIIVLLETLVAGIGGALAGKKAKAGGFAQVAR